MTSPLTVLVVCRKGHHAIQHLPEKSEVCGKTVEFPVLRDASEVAAFKGKIDAIIYIPPRNLETLKAVWKKLGPVPWIHNLAAGCEHLMPFIKEFNLSDEGSVTITNGRTAFSEMLAEFALTSIFYFKKQVPRLINNQLAKNYEKFPTEVVSGMTVAFIGFGHIAQTTARLLQRSLKIKIVVLKRTSEMRNIFDDLEVDKVYAFNRGEKLEAFREADVVISTLPRTDETDDFIGASEFSAMKSSAILVSMGRGSNVDEDALVAALNTKQIAGAASDVFKVEPLPDNSPLWNCENLLISPHNASVKLAWKVFERNMECFINGTDFLTPVDRNLGY